MRNNIYMYDRELYINDILINVDEHIIKRLLSDDVVLDICINV